MNAQTSAPGASLLHLGKWIGIGIRYARSGKPAGEESQGRRGHPIADNVRAAEGTPAAQVRTATSSRI